MNIDEKPYEKGYQDGKLAAMKKGHWLINPDGYYPYCSLCKNEPQNRVMTKYCPNCGADMREKS